MPHGEVQEWLNWLVSKTSVPQGTEGSNPSLSAKKNNDRPVVIFLGKLKPPAGCEGLWLSRQRASASAGSALTSSRPGRSVSMTAPSTAELRKPLAMASASSD